MVRKGVCGGVGGFILKYIFTSSCFQLKTFVCLHPMSKKKKSTGSTLQHDWEFFYKNSGKEYSIDGDRNTKRTACANYFKRLGKKVEVRSRYVDGVAYLMVVRIKEEK